MKTIIGSATPGFGGGVNFHSTQNPFQRTGPNRVIEKIVLSEWLVYYRIDLPGVSRADMFVDRNQSDKSVIVRNKLPRSNPNGIPDYETVVDLDCDCCRVNYISPFEEGAEDGVLRFILGMDIEREYRGGLAYHQRVYNTDPNDRFYNRDMILPHPFVLAFNEQQYAYEFDKVNAGINAGVATVRLNMPGVPADDFELEILEDRVTVRGVAPQRHHDSGGRTYEAVAAWLESRDGAPTAVNVERQASHGVMRLIIRPAA